MDDRVTDQKYNEVPLHPAAQESDAPQGGLQSFPPPQRWEDWTEFDPAQWPRRVERRYWLIPTICFNCEAACGLLAYVDKETLAIRKFEGNPDHPGSRGRNCAKGPATLNQVKDPERILYPLQARGRNAAKASGSASPGTRCSTTSAARIRKALSKAGATRSCITSAARARTGYIERVLQAWGIDGHNSHTNVCSLVRAPGYAFWHGFDRPSPDHANARFILLLSSHLEAGHYFNPHAQRIIEGKADGAKVARDRPAALEHRDEGRLLAVDLARHRGGGAARDGERAAA